MREQEETSSPIGSTAAEARGRRAARDTAYREQWASRAVAREIAWQVVKYRMDHGLTQEALAARVRTSRAQIARIESGQHLPSVATLQRIGNALECRLTITFEPLDSQEQLGTQQPSRTVTRHSTEAAS